MKDGKYTESEIETFKWIGLVLFIGLVIACGILITSLPEAGLIGFFFIIGYAIFYLVTGCFEGIFLAHNEKIDEYVELKLQAQLQAEAEEAEEEKKRLKRQAEEQQEMIRFKSQIWVV